MKRLGKFTGDVYGEDFDFSECPECCTIITDEQAKDVQFRKEKHCQDLYTCIPCMGCPAAKAEKAMLTPEEKVTLGV